MGRKTSSEQRAQDRSELADCRKEIAKRRERIPSHYDWRELWRTYGRERRRGESPLLALGDALFGARIARAVSDRQKAGSAHV